MTGISNDGFSWSSATNDINGLELKFYSRMLNISYSDHRAHGFQLRCLSE
ncbi:hypothetical protein [uncultured Rikenella sp.]|nr:hypothetical protein [uncultured Rikenella sp.]